MSDVTGKMNRQTFRMIGHRGAMAVHPENTMAGFRYLLDNGIDWVETDLRVNRNGTVILHHDPVTDEGIPVELAGSECDAVPLHALLDELPNLNVNLEIKIASVLDQLDSYPSLIRSPERFMFSSFQHDIVVQLKQRYPDIPCLFLVEGAFVGLAEYVLKFGVDGLVFQHEFYEESDIQHLIEQGLQVFSYPVNQLEEVLHFRNMGLTGIISDDPVALRDALVSHMR